MTTILRSFKQDAPAAAKSGLVVPGLGHLLVGEVLTGAGMMSLFGLAVWSAVAGFPRINQVLWSAANLPLTGNGIGTHAIAAIITWFMLVSALWYTAWRRAYPYDYSEEEYNANSAIVQRQFVKNRNGMLGLFLFLFLLMIVALTPLIAPHNPDLLDRGPPLASPSWDFFMGTDKFGRDVFSRLLYGGRISLFIGFIAVAIAASIGTTVGALAGYFGGWFDRFAMWVVDLLLALPRLVLLLTIVGLFRVSGAYSILLIVVVLGLTAWMGVARIVRGQVLSLKEQDFVQAARALGMSQSRIVFRHLIPNALAPVIVFCSLAIGGTMLAEAGLSFLGLGVAPPTSTWGVMVNDGREQLRSAPWIATVPGLAIVMAVMSFNLLGDGLRDALDPKQIS